MFETFASSTTQILLRIIFCLFIIGFTVWASFAIWYQAPFGKAACTGIIILLVLFSLWVLGSQFSHFSWKKNICYLIVALMIVGWWSTIRPSLDRMWAADVAKTVTGTVNGDIVTLHNIRDFTWRTPTDFDTNWKTETYNLDEITSVDVFLSYWMGPAIAHTLVSFGFADGRHVVFSAEIRKEHHEEFSSIGGFFRKFELAMIAAEESDIIFTRTNARGEDVYRYPINIDPQTAKTLFLNYVETGNYLAKTPEFYNTVSSNCTTVVFDLARMIDPGIPFNYKILLSGYLPDYLYDHGVIANNVARDQIRDAAYINKKAIGGRENYSERIRQP